MVVDAQIVLKIENDYKINNYKVSYKIIRRSKMNEFIKIKQKYFNANVNLVTIKKEKLYEYQSILLNINQYGDNNKGPDLISIKNNKVYGIEHFEFDSTKNFHRKGSSYKRQLANIDNIVDEEIKKKNYVKNLSPLVLNQNINQYINNFKEIFNKHYSKIDSYLNNLNLDYPTLEKEIWFFIEDVTPLGNTYLDYNCNPKQFQPMLSMELITLIENSTKLRCIVIAVGHMLYIFSNEKEEINIIKNICQKEQVNSLLVQNILCFTSLTKKEYDN